MTKSSEHALHDLPLPLPPGVPPPLFWTNAHDDAEQAHKTYLEAYEKCIVPAQSNFQGFAELDNEIIRQLTVANFGPVLPHRLYRIVERIRTRWAEKYGLKFNGRLCKDGRGPPGVLQPTSWTWRAGDPVEPITMNRHAGGEVANMFAPGNQYSGAQYPGAQNPAAQNPAAQYPSTQYPGTQNPGSAQVMATNHWPLPLPPRSDFTFRVPRPTKPWNFGRPAGFAGNSVAPKPLFANGKDPKLTWFERYTSLDRIHLPEKREKTERILHDLPDESIARCMEALFRFQDDVDLAEAWLRHTPLKKQDKHVIELFDSDDEDHQPNQEPNYEPAKKKQKVEPLPLAKLAKQERRDQRRTDRAMGRAMANLLEPMDAKPHVNNDAGAQSLLQPALPSNDPAQSNGAPNFIPLDTTLVVSGSGHDSRIQEHARREVIDLTIDDDEPMKLEEPISRPGSTVNGVLALNDTLKSEQTYFRSARTATPDPTIWENIFQDRSAAGFSLKQPMEIDEIATAVTSHKRARELQDIATAAQNEPTASADKSANSQPPTINKDDGGGLDSVSELEEGEIREDQPTAAASEHVFDAMENSAGEEHSSPNTSTGTLHVSTTRRDSGNGFVSSAFGAFTKPVFGLAWQPGYRGKT